MTTHASNGAGPGWSTDELRAAVRAVIREVLPDALPGGAVATEVSVSSDAELDTLVRRVAVLCEDPDRRAAIRDGHHDFRLVEGSRYASPGGSAARPPAPPDVTRVERGAVTERVVAKAAAAGSRLVIGPRAVLTPLARDRARVLGVEIEREH